MKLPILLDLENVVRSKGTTCREAVEVMNAWTKCRMKKDPYGYCTKKVMRGISAHMRGG